MPHRGPYRPDLQALGAFAIVAGVGSMYLWLAPVLGFLAAHRWAQALVVLVWAALLVRAVRRIERPPEQPLYLPPSWEDEAEEIRRQR